MISSHSGKTGDPPLKLHQQCPYNVHIEMILTPFKKRSGQSLVILVVRDVHLLFSDGNYRNSPNGNF